MKRLDVTFVNRNCAYVAGYGAREILTTIKGGRPPLWSTLGHAWSVTPSTAKDAISLAESRGFVIQVTEGDPVDLSGGVLF